MSDVDHSESVIEQLRRVDWRRWLAVPPVALLCATFRPVWTCRNSDHVGLFSAFASHVIGVFIFFLVLSAAIPIASFLGGDYSPFEYTESPMVALIDLFDYMPWAVAVAMIGVQALLSELGILFAAAVFMAWGARSESVRQSYIRALRRIWLLTCFPILPMLGWMFFITLASRYVMAFSNSATFDAGLHEYQLVALANAVFFVSFSFLGVGTVLWALASGRIAAHCRWPAACAQCGYSLLGIDFDRSCPECGYAIQHSLDPKARPGVAWELRNGANVIVRFIKTTLQGLFHPRSLARQMHTRRDVRRARHFFAAHLVILFFSAYFYVLMGAVVVQVFTFVFIDQELWISENDFLLASPMVAMFLGCFATGIALTVAAFAASASGALRRSAPGVSNMPAALQTACYGAGGFHLFTFIYWFAVVATILTVIFIEEYGTSSSGYWIFDILAIIATVFFGLLPLFFTIVYIAFVAVGSKTAKHANW